MSRVRHSRPDITARNQNGATPCLRNTELLCAQDTEFRVVSDLAEHFRIRFPYGQHCRHLLQDYRFVRISGSHCLQNPAERLENQACPVVIEFRET